MNPPAHRCTATAKASGEQCLRPAIPGGSVCRKHGGGAPQVKAAADRRILEASESIKELLPAAVRELKRLLEGDKTKQEVRLSALRDVFDRAGLVVVKKNEVKISEGEYTFTIESNDDDSDVA
jgi:hypothetical protein